jgi:hypothetical protein
LESRRVPKGPQREGQNGTPTIDPLTTDGPDLNDTAPLAYFYDKFIQESKVPATRFKGLDGSSTSAYSNGAEGLDKEEIRFGKFIDRLRSIFQEMLVKPLWLQVCKDIPALEKDFAFKSELGLTFITDNHFRINSEIELINKKKEVVDSLAAILGDEDKPYFSSRYLIENFLGLTQADIKANREAIMKKEKEKKEEGGEEKDEKEEITL